MTDQTPDTSTPAQETYNKEFVDKLLNEKKNYAKAVEELKLKTQAYESKFKEIEEQTLKQKEDWKTLGEMSQKEALEWKQKYEATQTRHQNTLKLGALKREFEKMGLRDAKTVEGIQSLIKFDAIRYDESTETIVGAEEEAKRIKEILPQVFIAMNNARTNHDATHSVPVTYSTEKLNEMVKSKAPIEEIRKYQRGLMDSLAKR